VEIAPVKDFLGLHLREMPLHRALLRSVEAQLMSQVQLRHPVLDIGTGDGHFAAVTYAEPLDVGIDLRRYELCEARDRVGTYRFVVLASATDLPFPDAAFQTVVSNSAIEHIPDLDAALSEIHRVLAPGGTFAATLPSEYFADFLLGSAAFRRLGLRSLSRGYGTFFNRISHHHHVHPPDFWREKLAEHGLHAVRHQYYFSAHAHRAFDLCHYLSVPNLITRLLVGKWVVYSPVMRIFDPWLRRYYEEPFPTVGAYQFLVYRSL
jgi:ubiquinone/menaquinone biosynthesis C-methylase UbiE